MRADYTFPAHRLNDVPICLYLMTHAYFMFYHVLSNAALRRARSAFRPGAARSALEAALVAALAYTTAFMESLTICGFPYYRFEDRDMAYTLGSAFYGIYFLARALRRRPLLDFISVKIARTCGGVRRQVSFPAFLRVDEEPRRPFSLAQTATEALAAGMAVLCLLDFVRLAVGVELFAPH